MSRLGAKFYMLRNIQIKIVLIFLVIGIVIIGAMGYINYTSLQDMQANMEEDVFLYDEMIQKYQEQLKVITLCTIACFVLICIFVRNICNSKYY